MMTPINIKTQLPTERQRCLWWHSQHLCWYFGWWNPETGPYAPGYFWGEEQAGYVFDGIATHWMPEPEAPEESAVVRVFENHGEIEVQTEDGEFLLLTVDEVELLAAREETR
jgi:hypothetical protein